MDWEIAKAIGLFLIGLVMLIKGGDWFVDGATGIARRFHLPELLIGATVVSIGTTLPEVMVSAQAAAAGQGATAYGNAIGSIICNTSLIAVLTIAIKPSDAARKSLILPVSFFFGAAAFYVTIAYTTGYFSRLVGVILLVAFIAYMFLNVLSVKKANLPLGDVSETELEAQTGEDHVVENEKDGTKDSLVKDIILLVVGAIVIAIGATFLVDNGPIIARAVGVPESVIALIFVALGTSLPELVTAVTALAKGHGALSLGNIIGANLFNLVLVSGISAVVGPFPIPSESTIAGINASYVLDIPLMLCVMLILTIPTIIKGKLSRWQGILMLLMYAAFCVVQFVM